LGNIVYLLGSGANQSIKDWDGLSPPMIGDLFKIALQKKKYLSEHFVNKMQVVYDYILKYWRKDLTELAVSSFNLEECYTMLESQANEALQKNDIEEYNRLHLIQFLLKSFLAEVLTEFEAFAYTSDTMRSFGRLIYKDKPTIITFNYDCFLESAIEIASMPNPSVPRDFLKPPPNNWPYERIRVSDEDLGYSHYNWNRPLGYGFTFNEVQLQRAGLRTYVEGNRFYSHYQNKLYSWPILKLHGSLNWFRYLPIRKYPVFPNTKPQQLGEKENQIILVKGVWWFAEPPALDGWIIDPIIITPILYKAKFFQQSVFAHLWERAKSVLSQCEQLVIIGYSFSPTDFSTIRLFRESFSDHDIQDLVIVNPDPKVTEKVMDLCHYGKMPLIYSNMEQFLHDTRT
jgi:hypothetical protein